MKLSEAMTLLPLEDLCGSLAEVERRSPAENPIAWESLKAPFLRVKAVVDAALQLKLARMEMQRQQDPKLNELNAGVARSFLETIST